MTDNRRAFLDTIATSEGTYGKGDDGYNVLVGGGLFEGYADHPRISVYLPRLGIHSTAAGRYQLLARYYDAYKAKLGLPDFSPGSQDAIALQQIAERKALELVDVGDINAAVLLVSPIWASFPGNNYGQHANSFSYLRQVFVDRGGVLAPDVVA